MTTQKIIGIGRIVDWNKESTTYRVRLYGEDGLPNGAVLTGVKLLKETTVDSAAVCNLPSAVLPQLSDEELDTIARQNLLYNSHNPVEIV